MGKIKYLTNRIKSMSYKRLFDTIDIIHERTSKNKIRIFFDVINCGYKYQAGYLDYLYFQMYNLNKEQRRTVLTRGINNEFVKRYNNPEYKQCFLDKSKFNEAFKPYLNRDYIYLDDHNKEEFKKFIKGRTEVFAKPTGGTHGDNMMRIKLADYKDIDLYDFLVKKNLRLIEELIIQCDEMNKLNPSSVNTVRFITVCEDGITNIIAAYLRIGNGKIVDNFNGGGMVTPLDIETGKCLYPAVDKKEIVYEKHPTTNTVIKGFQVPMFKDAIELVKKAAPTIPQIKYVGWDIGFSIKGPTIIEGNEYPGHDIYQLPPHTKDKIGVLPQFEKYLKRK